MSTKYSKKVYNLLLIENNYKNKLSILFEEDESEDEGSKNNKKEIEKPENTDDSGDENKGEEGLDFEFPSDSEDSSKGESDEEDIIDDVVDSSDEKSVDSGDDTSDSNNVVTSQDFDALEKQLSISVDDLSNRIKGYGDNINAAFNVDTEAENFLDLRDDEDNLYLDDYQDDIYQDDIYQDEDSDFSQSYDLLSAGYQKKSIKDFIYEVKEDVDKVKQKKFDDIEAQIEKLEYLTDLLDNKFNRKTNVIDEKDLPDIVSKSIDLIKHHDPVSYAYNETIKYINVKGELKIKERLVEDFKVMFTEACSKEGYDCSSITGISSISPTRFKTGIVGGEK